MRLLPLQKFPRFLAQSLAGPIIPLSGIEQLSLVAGSARPKSFSTSFQHLLGIDCLNPPLEDCPSLWNRRPLWLRISTEFLMHDGKDSSPGLNAGLRRSPSGDASTSIFRAGFSS